MPVAVINEVHSVAVRIQAWMLREVGFDVWCAGGSWRAVVPNYNYGGRAAPPLFSGVMEMGATPPDALVVDTHPDTERALRARGMPNPLLIVWQMPVGPEWVRDNFKPGRNVGSMGWSTAVGRAIAEMGTCPNDHFWPPPCWIPDTSPRGAFEDRLITVVENASGWSNVPVLERLRDDPGTRLELYGGGPPAWARRIPQADLFARMRSARAMYHLKPFDTPGLAVMEAAVQGVPLILPRDWIKHTASEEVFEDGASCLVVETDAAKVAEAAARLRDPALNAAIGLEGRRRMARASDWAANRVRFEALVRETCAGVQAAAPAAPAEAQALPVFAFAREVHESPDARPAWLRAEVDEPDHLTAYYRFLHAWARSRRPARMVETGTLHGHSAIHLSDGNPDGLVVTVDRDPAAAAEAGAFGRANIAAVTGTAVESFGRVKDLIGGEADLLFLDASMSLPDALEEYRLYRTLVRKGGLILMDDIHINPDMERVWAAVEDPKAEANFLHYRGFGIAVKR